jgi:HEAT repeat protein
MAIVRTSLLGLVAACVAHGALLGQDGDPQVEKFRNAYFAAMTQNKEKALQLLQEILRDNPTNEDALNLWRRVDRDKWVELLRDEGEMGKLAKHILSLAQAGRKEMSRDESAIQALVEKACADAYSERASAIVDLMKNHGEFAVPALVEKLGNHDDPDGQTYAIIALDEIGRRVSLPLIEATKSDNPTLRRNIAAVFNLSRDHRAVPALTELLKDSDEGVVEVARTALGNMGADLGASAVDLYTGQAAEYLIGIGTQGTDISDVVWAFDNGKLVHRDTHAAVYPYELAKQSAERALTLDQTSVEASTLIARSYLAQVAAIDTGKIADLEPVKPSLKMVAMAMGPKILGRALTASIEAGQAYVAVAAIEALGATVDKDSLAGTPLVSVLDSDNKMLRYAAALALASASRANDVPAAGRVVDVLAQAVSEQSMKRVASIGLDNSNNKATVEASSMKEGIWTGEPYKNVQGAVGSMMRGSSRPDVVLVNDTLSDGIPEDVIGLLGRYDHTKDIKIVIVATDVEKAQERFGDRVAGVIEAGFKPEDLQAEVNKALEGVELDTHAAAVAVEASQALHRLAGNRVDIRGALDSLDAQLKRADDVAVPAAKALGEGGSRIDGLVGVITDSSSSLDLKKAAAEAAGKILGRIHEIEQAHFDALKGVAGNAEFDANLRTAVVTALGKADLKPAQQLELVKTLSTMAVASPSGE